MGKSMSDPVVWMEDDAVEGQRSVSLDTFY